MEKIERGSGCVLCDIGIEFTSPGVHDHREQPICPRLARLGAAVEASSLKVWIVASKCSPDASEALEQVFASRESADAYIDRQSRPMLYEMYCMTLEP